MKHTVCTFLLYICIASSYLTTHLKWIVKVQKPNSNEINDKVHLQFCTLELKEVKRNNVGLKMHS